MVKILYLFIVQNGRRAVDGHWLRRAIEGGLRATEGGLMATEVEVEEGCGRRG